VLATVDGVIGHILLPVDYDDLSESDRDAFHVNQRYRVTEAVRYLCLLTGQHAMGDHILGHLGTAVGNLQATSDGVSAGTLPPHTPIPWQPVEALLYLMRDLGSTVVHHDALLAAGLQSLHVMPPHPEARCVLGATSHPARLRSSPHGPLACAGARAFASCAPWRWPWSSRWRWQCQR
jgi:hypothetical protein